MVIVDEEKCVGCARCVPFCPREALKAWGWCEVDINKCTDCFGGQYHFEENVSISSGESVLGQSRKWQRNCVINCSTGALSVKEEEA